MCVGGGGNWTKSRGGEWDQKQGANVGVKDTFEGGGVAPVLPTFLRPWVDRIEKILSTAPHAATVYRVVGPNV